MVRCSMRLAVVAAIFAIGGFSASSLLAQGRGPGGPGGFGAQFGGGGVGLMGLLEREDVRSEIEFLPEQLEKVRELQTSLREELRGQFEGLRDLSQDERRARFENLRTEAETRNKEIEAKLNDILLPTQTKRLKQISLQQRIQRVGTIEALKSEELGLGLTEADSAKLEELAKEAEKALQEAVAKARAEAIDKILSGLSPEQRAKAKEALGTPFVSTQQAPRFGQPGAAGGQPGQGRQRGGARGDNN